MNNRFAHTIRLFFFTMMLAGCHHKDSKQELRAYNENHRPQIHFSPRANWMNDPNGMVFHNGIYHLFFQYYPDSTVWGPMHWGHATSSDLVHWEETDIALFPDTLGYIFSGSAVVDLNNTSGFGEQGKAPLVAIFSYHDPVGEKEGKINYQTQGLAYSNDDGKTWKKYAGNPVLKNPGIKDFRDPKVMWYEAEKKWIMSLAVLDHIRFYSSTDLKNWKLESEFGKNMGAHGGVWECPDLFQLSDGKDSAWFLFVSINPGGPNSGSATQYFPGTFDGKIFTAFDTITRWIDHGPDNYAGVTWSNTEKRKIFMGWMGNWDYAQKVPTHPWRSAMTIARDLHFKKMNGNYFLTSLPAKELSKLESEEKEIKYEAGKIFNLTNKEGAGSGSVKLQVKADKIENFRIRFSNEEGQYVEAGYEAASNNYFIDRTKSGKTDFGKGFGAKSISPRLSQAAEMELIIILDVASMELFADDGLNCMTSIFFPEKPYSKFEIHASGEMKVNSIQVTSLQSIWSK